MYTCSGNLARHSNSPNIQTSAHSRHSKLMVKARVAGIRICSHVIHGYDMVTTITVTMIDDVRACHELRGTKFANITTSWQSIYIHLKRHLVRNLGMSD